MLSAYAEDMSLDPASPIPLHYQLFRVLKQFALRQHLTTADKLPSEALVAEVFGVSRPTASRAIRGFVDQQQLTRARGRGSFFLSSARFDLTLLADSLSLVDAIRPPSRLTTETVVHTVTRAIPEEIRDLGLAADCPAVFLRRLRSVDGKLIMVCDSYLPAELFPGLHEREMIGGSLYATLASAYGRRVVRSDRSISVAEVIDRTISKLLDVPILSPVFVLTGASYDESGRLCEVMVSHVVGEARFTNTVGVSREPGC